VEESEKSQEEDSRKNEEGSIQEEKIRIVVRKTKNRKTVDINRILEAWKYAGKDLWNGLVKLFKQIWKIGVISEDWRKSIVVPMYKKGDRTCLEITEESRFCVQHIKYT